MSVTGVLTAKFTPDCLYSWRSLEWIISFPASTFTLAPSISIRFAFGVIMSVPITWAWLPALIFTLPSIAPKVLRASDCVQPSDSTWCFSDFEPKVMPPPLVNTPDVFFVCWCTSLNRLVSAARTTSSPAWILRFLSAMPCSPLAFTSLPALNKISFPLSCVPTWLSNCALSKLVFVVFAKLPLFVWWNSSKSELSFAPFKTKSFSAIAVSFSALSSRAPSDKRSFAATVTSPLPLIWLTTAFSIFSRRESLPPPIFSSYPTESAVRFKAVLAWTSVAPLPSLIISAPCASNLLEERCNVPSFGRRWFYPKVILICTDFTINHWVCKMLIC